MTTTMSQFRFSVIGLAIAFLLLTTTILFELDLFESLVEFLHRFEEHEIDEFILPAAIALSFMGIDAFRVHKHLKVEESKVKIYSAMLSALHHILNNFLNQMLLFKMAAQETKNFDPEILALYEQVISETSASIEELGNIHEISETAIAESVAPKSSSI